MRDPRARRIRNMVATQSTISGPWSEAEIVALIRLRETGESTTNIALSLGRTRDSVDSKLVTLIGQGRIRLKRRAYSPEEDRILAEMYEAGETLSSIAAVLGRTRESVGRRRAYLDIPAVRVDMGQPWATGEDDTLCRLYTDHPVAEIAAILCRTPESVRSRATYLRKRGVQIPRRPGCITPGQII